MLNLLKPTTFTSLGDIGPDWGTGGTSSDRILESLQPHFATAAADFKDKVNTLDPSDEQSMLNFQLSQARFKTIMEFTSTLIKLFAEGNRRIMDNMR
jgi:hypothetical protein